MVSRSSSPLFSSLSLSVPRLLSYNIRSASFYASNPRSLSRRASISYALSSFVSSHDIICLQETHLDANEIFAFDRPGCIISRNNFDCSRAGTAIIDTPGILNFYSGCDIPLPPITRGHAQLRRYSPLSSNHPPFQVFNVYFKSGDFDFNLKIINAISNLPNNIDTFICGDFNFIENAIDSSSTSHSLPPASFISAFNNLKAYYSLYDPPHSSHTFFHITSDASSPYSWSSRIDRFLLPLSLFNNPLITPTISIPYHSSNLRLGGSSSSFSDHLPIHVSYDNGTVCHRDQSTIPTWLAQSPEYASSVRSLWRGNSHGGAFRAYAAYKKVLFKAAFLTRKANLKGISSLSSYSLLLSLYRAVHSPIQDFSLINALLSRDSSFASLVSFDNTRWCDKGILNVINDYQLSSFFSDAPPSHPIKDLASRAPFSRSRVGPLRSGPDSDEAINDADRSRVAADFWSKVWAKRDVVITESSIKTYLKDYDKKINADLISDITYDDILSSIKKSNNSSPGPDGVSFAAWRAVPEFSAKILYDVFKAISMGQPPPAGFNKGLLFLLPKKFTGLISDTRPISVTNTDNRIIAAAIAHKIMPAVIDFIDPAQKGFLAGKQGSDHICDVNAFFYEGVENDDERYLFLLDTAKAFDSIDHRWINYILRRAGFPSWLLNFVSAALSNVVVSPYFGRNTSVWIDIERGVKQGCPLSPLLFLIAYDPLLHFLRIRTNNSYYAFADDLATTAHNIRDIFPALSIIDEFSFFSGLGVNKDKSLVISSLPLTYYPAINSLLASSPWPLLPLKPSATYLGVVIGREVTLNDIWEVPMRKALERINTCRSFVHSLSLSKRILFANVFIVSLFSYIALFYVFPTALWRRLRCALAKFIISFNGTAFTYEALVCGNLSFKINPALKDVWAFGISLLAVRSNYIFADVPYLSLPKINLRSTKIISRHRDAAAVDFWRGYHNPDGSLIPLNVVKSTDIYKIIIRDVYYEDVLLHYGSKYQLFMGVSPHSSLSPASLFQAISDNLRASRVPPFLSLFFFKFINNALPSSRRCRHIHHISIQDVARCFFCHSDQDSVAHIFSACVVISLARIRFFSSLSLSLSPLLSLTSPPPSPLPPSSVVRPHLFPSLRSFLASLSPSSSSSASSLSVPVHIPLSASCLVGVPTSYVVPILAFNYAVWTFRRPAFAASASHSREWLVNRIFELSNVMLNKSKPRKNLASSVNPNYQAAFDKHNSIVSSINNDSVVCFTDGSALTNPGNCGSGVSVFVCAENVVIDAGVSIGHGTNNIGELMALAICFNVLLQTFARRHFLNAYIFSDSSYCIGLLHSSRKPSSNVRIVDFLRAIFAYASSKFKINLFWIKGHASVGGNVRVDSLSKHFAKLPKASGNDVTWPNKLAYSFLRSPWDFSVPLNLLPPHYFVPANSFGDIARWPSSCFINFNYVPASYLLLPAIGAPEKRINNSLPGSTRSPKYRRISRVASARSSFAGGYYDASVEPLDFKHSDPD